MMWSRTGSRGSALTSELPVHQQLQTISSISLEEPRKNLSKLRDQGMLMNESGEHREPSQSTLTCKWCGRPVTVFRWMDGKNIYCSSRCLSAGLFPVMLFCALIFTPILMGTVMFPDAMYRLVLYGVSIDPSSEIPPLSRMLIGNLIGVFCVAALWFWYEAHKGWRVRQETRDWHNIKENENSDGGRFEGPVSEGM
jgi:hypothetical protein